MHTRFPALPPCQTPFDIGGSDAGDGENKLILPEILAGDWCDVFCFSQNGVHEECELFNGFLVQCELV